MITAAVLAIYGIGVIGAWGRIVAPGPRGQGPLTLRQSGPSAAGYALAWPILGACALAVMIVGRLRS